MLSVGLTGGIACGKSTVAQMFVRLGAYLIDFDMLAHEVQEPEGLAWKEVIEYFGRDILQPDKRIDRNKLAQVVFSDAEKLKKLNSIVHPQVFRFWQNRLEEIKANDPRAIVLSDVPLLFEGGWQSLFDLTVLILIPPAEQIRRLMARNGSSNEEAQKRLKSQMPICEKIKLADIVIDNQGALDETENIVRTVWRDLLLREEKKKLMNS
jgi:dephospho-CoA kinase